MLRGVDWVRVRGESVGQRGPRLLRFADLLEKQSTRVVEAIILDKVGRRFEICGPTRKGDLVEATSESRSRRVCWTE